MTFEKLIKLLDVLNNDGEILVMIDEGYPREVCRISYSSFGCGMLLLFFI